MAVPYRNQETHNSMHLSSNRLNAIKKKYSVEQAMSLGRDDSNSSSLNNKRVTSALGSRDTSRTIQNRSTLRSHKFNPAMSGDASHKTKNVPI